MWLMFSWPQLPSVSLPTTIQRRFLSFVLKRFLGHLVKPGQLDPAQIDAQIGSGFVQVNGVQLDHDAINKHLTDLPLPFYLQDGTIGRISVRIPWSNLLSAPFALSLSSLSLTFVIFPRAKPRRDYARATDDLTESVASMAETFIHDELSERDNQNLHESIHLESIFHRRPPGSIDPFLSTEDVDPVSHTQTYDHDNDDENHAAPSMQGVSLLASLIERLLAKFEFDASDITVRFVLPKEVEFVVRLGQVQYSTARAQDMGSPVEKSINSGELRTITVSDFTISTRDLSPPPSSISRRRSPSPLDSSSSDDGDVMMMMSQSLASLPPPPSPRSVSPGLSMYHSAASSVRNPSPELPLAVEDSEPLEEKILSLGTGSEPVVLTLITPPLLVPEVQVEPGQGHTHQKPRFQLSPTDRIQLTLTIGPVAIALSPIHMRSIYHLSTVLLTPHPVDRKPSQAPPFHPNLFDASIHIKSITTILLQPWSPAISFQTTATDALQHFFLARHVPSFPRIPHLRIHLDALGIIQSSVPNSTSSSSMLVSASSPGASTYHVITSLNDISVFAFFSRGSETGDNWIASPVLLSDPNLGSEYQVDEVHFPMIEVLDWTKGGAAKVSLWRIHQPHVKRSSGGIPSPTVGGARAQNSPVIKARVGSDVVGQNATCEVDVTPLHLFVDVGIMDGAIRFINAAMLTIASQGETSSNQNKGMDTPTSTPRMTMSTTPWSEDEQLRQRKKLEALVMDDFPENDADIAASAGMKFVLRLALLRTQVRAPPPVSWTSKLPRSGALVLDVHGLQVTQQDEAEIQRGVARFESPARQMGPKVLGMVEFKTLFAAASLPGDTVAMTFLSISTPGLSTTEHAVISSRNRPCTPVLASVCLRSNRVLPHTTSTTFSPGDASSFSLDVHLSSVHVTISKPMFNGLAFLADDVTQKLLEDGDFVSTSETSGRSRDPSLIGSRYFTRRTASTESSENGAEGRKSEIVVKLSVQEFQITLLVPSQGNAENLRPLQVTASDVDFLAELKPEGKDQTVVTIGVMDLHAHNKSISGETIPMIRLTVPRSLSPSSKPFLKLRLISVVDGDTGVKESRLKVTVSGFTYLFTPDLDWVNDLGLFAKTPEGAFESVVPNERTKLVVNVIDGSFHIVAPKNPGALVAYIGELDISTDLIGDSPEILVNTAVSSACFLFIDDGSVALSPKEIHASNGMETWKHAGYALLAEVANFCMRLRLQNQPSVNTQVYIDSVKLKLHACADFISAVAPFGSDLASIFGNCEKPSVPKGPAATSHDTGPQQSRDVFASVDEDAFRRAPDLGPAPDMIRDDLPTNLDYLDASFGAAAGLREMRDEDLFDFEQAETSGRNTPTVPGMQGVIANFGGETIRMLDPQGIQVVEGHFQKIPPMAVDLTSNVGETGLNVRIRDCDLTVSLYDGYDWVRTRKAIEDEIKAIRRRLAKIRQLLASGQVPDDSIEETSSILFNSVYLGLPQDPAELEPNALIAAIDEELNDETETGSQSQSSWQSLKRKQTHDVLRPARVRNNKLGRSRNSRIDFCLTGVHVDYDQFQVGAPLVSKVLITVMDIEILDHIKTSTWRKFLTELRTDFRGNVRETGSDMFRAELRIVHPVPDLPTEEGRLRAKMLPIKLHVDQDALDFMKKFFSFEAHTLPSQPSPEKELYFQHVEVFPVDIKLDYKPKRVDYKALREGKTIELMNFFHFDGAEITLRHMTLSGITGWSRLFETLNDLWTPDVKANQLADIISGVSPVRSLVNVGTGVADLVLLPIAQYKKDKRVVRGVQKGTTSFVKSTAMEAIKLGARLATGTQVILERAETVLGGQGQFRNTVTAEALQSPMHSENSDEESEVADLISKYADQPLDVREGMQTAYRSLAKNFSSAAQTILAVPMEVYERSGDEGPVRAVVRAVPIAVLKPMIGASEAVSKTLFGLHNTMDPEARHENEAKYKQR